MKIRLKSGLLVGVLLIVTMVVSGQATKPATAQEQNKPTTTTSPATSTPIAAGMKTKILEVRHRDPVRLQVSLNLLLSSAPGAAMIPDQQYRTLTIRDFPENIAAVEDALKRLDVLEPPTQPKPAGANFEVILYLLTTSKTPTDKSTMPTGLEPVVTQLQDTLKYKGYRLITTILNRTEEHAKIEGSGVTDALFPLPTDSGKSFYSYFLSGFSTTLNASGDELIRLVRFQFSVKSPIVIDGKGTIQYQDVGINTSLSLREGEKVVVGTANLGISEEAIIVVVSVKKIR